MLRLAQHIDRLSTTIGRVAAWLVLAAVLLQFAVVVLRYIFGVGSIRLQESVIYAHALAFLLAAAWALRTDSHVRVDVFYGRASPRTRARIDLFGTLLLLAPTMILILWTSIPYAARAWATMEGSQETAGLPFVFLLKSVIPLFAALMLLQGAAQAMRAASALGAQSGR
jgi:TRAP-type mannitol/chloroaromatic compound transport system permease small subunit